MPIDHKFEDRDLSRGKYNYRLKQIDLNGNFRYYDLNNEVVIVIVSENSELLVHLAAKIIGTKIRFSKGIFFFIKKFY
ncbi:MAG TPA: hypothetical protein PK294_10425 [Ignavibacteria bacterium]|nr:hypothetical protein [Ignavibacteria bacterium]HQY52848.1 hypothetical protein [Ignavibacteria bacterium]HRB00839.1 hypothetical protein [Ignavibacteria bacterium]